MKCSSCGESNSPGMRFCVACGHPLMRDTGALPHPESEPSLLSPGTVLKSTYEILRPLGEGGAGAVYEGRHIDLGHPVAIKVLFGNLARNPTIRGRFIEEGRIQANLRHPNVVQVHDIIDESGRVAIVMEYIDGESLHTFIHRQKQPVPLTFAVHLVLRLLAGLGAAHANGVIHRDIKPGNILLARADGGLVPKLCDFGIAKVVAARGRTVTGTKMGTVHYMAPEQFQDARGVDLRADIYSLGVTLYELLTQRLPFESENEFAIIRAHLEVAPPSPKAYRPDISFELDSLVLKALAKKPEDRFESCAAMAQALIALPGFDTLKGYASDPAVLEQASQPGQRAVEPRPLSQEPGVAAMRRLQNRDRPRQQRSADGPDLATLVHPQQTAATRSHRIPWFPIFLVVFAVGLVVSVVLWWPRRQQSRQEEVTGEPSTLDAVVVEYTGSPRGDGEIPAVIAEGAEKPPAQAESADSSSQSLEGQAPFNADYCLSMAEQVAPILSLSTTDGSVLGQALEQAADSCRQLLMESVGDNPFDVLWAQVHADQLLIARQLLRAYQEDSPEQRCIQVVLANRAYGRALERIRSKLEEGGLLEFEAASIRDLGARIQENQNRLYPHFPECSP